MASVSAEAFAAWWPAATLTVGSSALGVPLSAFNAVAFDRALSRGELEGYFLYPLEDLLAFDARTDWIERFST